MKSNKKDELTTGCSCKTNEIFSSSPGNLNWGYFIYFGNISKHVQHFLENKHKSASLAAFIIMGNCSLGNLDVPPKQNPKKAANQQSDVVSPSGFHSAGCSLCANATTLFPSIPHIPDFVGVCRVCLRDLASSRTMLLSKTQMTWSQKNTDQTFSHEPKAKHWWCACFSCDISSHSHHPQNHLIKDKGSRGVSELQHVLKTCTFICQSVFSQI